MFGVKVRSKRYYSQNNDTVIDSKGSLAVEVENKGAQSVFVNDVEIPGYEKHCFPEFSGRLYCEQMPIRFTTQSATELVEVTFYLPINEECC